MQQDQCQTVMEIMNRMEGVNLHEKRGGRFNFPMYVNKSMEETPIDCLDLSPRSYHSLKRAGMSTIAEVIELAASEGSLGHIRNCGAKSVREIMSRLFVYQYEILSPERQERFLQDVVAMNSYGSVGGDI